MKTERHGKHEFHLLSILNIQDHFLIVISWCNVTTWKMICLKNRYWPWGLRICDGFIFFVEILCFILIGRPPLFMKMGKEIQQVNIEKIRMFRFRLHCSMHVCTRMIQLLKTILIFVSDSSSQANQGRKRPIEVWFDFV